MLDPLAALKPIVSAAIAVALGEEFTGIDPLLRPANPRQTSADIQANAAMALAKKARIAPRDLAQEIVATLEKDERAQAVISHMEIAGPGFINFTLHDSWVAQSVTTMAADNRLGVPETPTAENIPIDYSAPNIAKEMHVGHLRTTVVGDSLARILEHLGHNVIRQNHIGDWGTPFGMLIEHLLDVGKDSAAAQELRTSPNTFYQAARKCFETDEEFAVRARARVTKLQSGDPETIALWQELVNTSKEYFHEVYSRLGVTLTDDDIAGESFYNDQLPEVCSQLENAGIAKESAGALCVFLPGYTGRDDKPLPLIIRKSDGGYGYPTSDIATIKYRSQTLHADRVIYVVGAPQNLHLTMCWETARLAGWVRPETKPIHVQIGNVLGDDGKILRTRSGAPVSLISLLDEAVEHATAVVAESRPDLPASQRAQIARQVGIGAVKYADLSVSHDSPYGFSFDRMLALTGNTGPYLQYAGARIASILRKAAVAGAKPAQQINIDTPAERALALRLLSFGAVVAEVGETLQPHRLCAYLFDIAQHFTSFYEACPILPAEPAVRASRLALAAATQQVLATGLGLLGVESPEQM